MLAPLSICCRVDAAVGVGCRQVSNSAKEVAEQCEGPM